MSKVAFITGITGQDGSYLAELLLAKGYEVHGLMRPSSNYSGEKLEDIQHMPHDPDNRLFLHRGDLSDTALLMRLIYEIKPEEVYHLGAQSHVRISFDTPIYTGHITGMSCMALLEAIRVINPKIRFYQASSSEMFGKVHAVPQSETTPFHPRSPYGVAKVYGYWAAVNYRESYNMHVSNGILFNHESPRRGENFVTRKITRAVACILAQKQEKLFLGNIEARRDWGYAKEYVEAMWMMLQQDEGDDYVVATGETYSVQDFLELAFGMVDLDWQDYVEQSEHFLRPAEVDLLVGDPSKAEKKLGWKAKVHLRELVEIMLKHDLQLEGLDPAQFIKTKSLKAA